MGNGMTLPTQIKVGSMVYQVFCSDEDWNQAILDGYIDSANPAWAQTKHQPLIIRLRPHMAEAQNRDSLLHEVLHCIWHQGPDLENIVGRLNDHEEYLVERQSPLLLTVLRENPELIHYLLGDLKPSIDLHELYPQLKPQTGSGGIQPC